VFISATLSAHGPPAALVRAARDGVLDVVVSIHLLAEIRDVLRRPRFRRFLSLTEVDELIDEIGGFCRVEADPEPGPPVLRDPDDDYLIHLAREFGADCIVSGDADITDETFEPPALAPRQAVDRFSLP
jgi:putative PIN family toxin of toxin-antitoxin system